VHYQYYLAVLSASRKFVWPPLRKLINVKNIRFATTEEITKVTGLEVIRLPDRCDTSIWQYMGTEDIFG